MTLDATLNKIDENLDAALDRLMAFLRISSISTDPAYKADCDAAADWLVADLASIGIDASKRETPGHPMVVGHIDGPDDTPHLLFYGHYDVQPVDPLELWTSPPFEPQIEEQNGQKVLRGRGSSDDKGQLMTFVEACRAWKAVNGTFPCRITFFFEGEEESGSPSLIPFMKENAEELKADIALICDTGLAAAGIPGIATQLRGMVKEEFTLIGPDRDLHSGLYGGPAVNPLREMSHMIASFHDTQTGAVAVEGFYEGVPDIPADIRRQWNGWGFDEAEFLGAIGQMSAHGERDYTALEQVWARPTLEINGMWGGYQGAGTKTVIASEAHCKLTCRLVGEQDPAHIRDCIRAHVEARLPADITVEWNQSLDGSSASVMDITRAEFELARAALSDEWGVEAIFVGMGGSIPIAGYFKDILGLESMLVGFANDDDAIHSPNEKYNIESFHKGTRSWARILAALGTK